MIHAKDIVGVIDSIAFDGKEPIWSDAEWTKQIKTRLCRLGKNFRYWVYASTAENTDGGEWLYDLTWLNYSGNKLTDVELVLESEWSVKGVDEDFQKLMLARAELRVMIFQSKNMISASEKMQDLKSQVNKFTKSCEGDAYLFSCWVNDVREFHHEQYIYSKHTNQGRSTQTPLQNVD